jgi:hypothetical protein
MAWTTTTFTLLAMVMVMVMLTFTVAPVALQLISQPAAGSWNHPGGPDLQFSTHVKIFNHRRVTAYLAVVGQPLGYFQVMYPALANHSCGGYLNTTQVAQQRGCLFATNGGPFVMNQPPGQPTCLGYIVANGSLVLLDSTNNANFGLTQRGDFVMGTLSTDQVLDGQFVQLLSGFGWLLLNGTSMVPTSGGEIAPRTAIGTDAAGRLLIFEADVRSFS